MGLNKDSCSWVIDSLHDGLYFGLLVIWCGFDPFTHQIRTK